MIVPAGFSSFKDSLRAGVEIFHHLKKLLKTNHESTAVGDEGGFAPNFGEKNPHETALSAISQAVKDSRYQLGKEIFIALDVASSEFASLHPNNESEYLYQFEGKKRTSDEMIEIYSKWLQTYPIISIEDGIGEQDWKGWEKMTQAIGNQCQLVGDDLFVTNPKFLQKGIDKKIANSILIKLNQIGTVTETLETIKLAQNSKYTTVISHRSGETEDTFIADLAVATASGQIKTGSASRSDRMAKYNQLLRIEENLGSHPPFLGKNAFFHLGNR